MSRWSVRDWSRFYVDLPCSAGRRGEASVAGRMRRPIAAVAGAILAGLLWALVACLRA
ncbi:MAG TPA: hypothetical protein PKO09_05650 [Anaerolineae bacterium]|nr:hypothetical protein [Anaerolineae bacterium]